MLAMADAGFVFLSMPKAGSTIINRTFGPHAQIVVRRPPKLKHISAARFEKVFAPWLAVSGFPRETYETMCLVRDPVDRAVSWWNYRARGDLAGTDNYTGDLSFEEFAERLMDRRIKLGTASNFVTDQAGNVLVDRLYRYDNLPEAVAWMAGLLHLDPPVMGRANASTKRELTMAASTRTRLEQHFAADLELYRSAR